jgi:hypothetical protein
MELLGRERTKLRRVVRRAADLKPSTEQVRLDVIRPACRIPSQDFAGLCPIRNPARRTRPPPADEVGAADLLRRDLESKYSPRRS